MLAIRAARTPDIVRIAKASGHHAIMVDLEHSTMTLDVAGQMCATAGDLGLTAFVRVPEREYGAIGRLLDGGAAGIVAPRVETEAEARTLARACRFPPRGQRSQLAAVPQYGFRPLPAARLNPLLDGDTIVKVLIETPAGVEASDAIAAVEGVDLLAIGANDLTAEFGCPGRYDDPRLRRAIETVAAACRRHGKPLMLGGFGDLSLMAEMLPLGIVPLYLTGNDADLLFTAAADRVAKFSRWHESRQH